VKHPPYPRYKPSGIEWLGDVPEHWEVRRLKDCGELSAGSGFPPEFQGQEGEGLQFYKVSDLAAAADGRRMGLAPNTISKSTASHLRARVIPTGAVVYAKIGAALFLNRRRVTTQPCCIDNNMTAFVPNPKRVSTEWSLYWTSILDFAALANPGAVPSLSEGYQATLPAFVPPASEQRSIVTFLNAQATKLDRLLGEKRALIERLQEKRAALISRTVTRGLPPAAARAAGLDPVPRLKPSGIEWLGDVPEHWAVTRLCRAFLVLDCKHRTVSFVDDGIPVASIREVHGFEVDLSEAKRTTEGEYLDLIEGDRRPRPGDIIYSRNASVGDAAIVTTSEPFCLGQDVCLIRPGRQVPRFLIYLLRSDALTQQVDSLTIGATFRRINVGQIKAFWVCLPPAIEQQAIAEFLDRETPRIDQISAKVQAAIDRLQEYRAALITAAVTGKIDVRPAVV
jgi:type I restriction enzyme S subunit